MRVTHSQARLLAAAPEMLEALKLLVEFTERQTATWPDQPQSLRKASSAIAKAEGRAS